MLKASAKSRAAVNCAAVARWVRSPDSTTTSGRRSACRRSSASTAPGRSVPKCTSDTCSRRVTAPPSPGSPVPPVPPAPSRGTTSRSGASRTAKVHGGSKWNISPSSAMRRERRGAARRRPRRGAGDTLSVRNGSRSTSRSIASRPAAPASIIRNIAARLTGGVANATSEEAPSAGRTPTRSSCSALLPTNRIGVRRSSGRRAVALEHELRGAQARADRVERRQDRDPSGGARAGSWLPRARRARAGRARGSR